MLHKSHCLLLLFPSYVHTYGSLNTYIYMYIYIYTYIPTHTYVYTLTHMLMCVYTRNTHTHTHTLMYTLSLLSTCIQNPGIRGVCTTACAGCGTCVWLSVRGRSWGRGCVCVRGGPYMGGRKMNSIESTHAMIHVKANCVVEKRRGRAPT